MGFVNALYGNSRTAEIIRHIMLRLRLYYPYNRFVMWKKRINSATSELTNSIDYFTKNQNRIENNTLLLSDEKSVDTYLKLIRLRQFWRAEDIPQYNYFDQYFPKDIPGFMDWEKDCIYLDCGAFSGDTYEVFAHHNPNYSTIIAFEPDPRKIESINHRCIRDLKIIQSACMDYDGTVCFSINTGGGSKTDESGELKVPCCKIDSVIGEGQCHYIKMDIEGAEMNALRGASETIIRNKPRMAISIYHSDQDMVDIMEYIHQLVPEYRLYVRAHTMGIAETILYALI